MSLEEDTKHFSILVSSSEGKAIKGLVVRIIQMLDVKCDKSSKAPNKTDEPRWL